MSVEELKEYQTLLMKNFSRAQAVKNRLVLLMTINQTIFEGHTLAGTEADSYKSSRRLLDQYPDKFLAPAPRQPGLESAQRKSWPCRSLRGQ